MRFGLFGSAQAKRGGPDVDSGVGFREFVDYNVEAEALGFWSTFLVEHHFTGFGQISATLNLLTFIAARTKTLRLGTAVLVVPVAVLLSGAIWTYAARRGHTVAEHRHRQTL